MNSYVTRLPSGRQRISECSLKVALLLTFIMLLLTRVPSYINFSSFNLFQYIPSSASSSSSSSAPPSPPPPPPPPSVNKAIAGGCDFSSGEWVRDPEAPYYTNTSCRMIQKGQNCMKHGRPDTDFFKWRWKPDQCQLPHFDPARFLELVRGKSLAFVGDSLARNHMQSLICLLSKVGYPEDVSNNSDEKFKRMFYTNFNFTISVFWSPFLVKSQEENLGGQNQSAIKKLYLDEADEKWASHINEFDYVIISAGNWFIRPLILYEKKQLIGCHYCQDKNVASISLQYTLGMAFRTTFRTINKQTGFKGMAYLRTISLTHFENGTWNEGGDCTRTRPYGSNETNLKGVHLELYKTQVEEFVRAKSEGRRRRLEFRLLDITKAMLLRPDGHPSHYGHWPHESQTWNDCLHWCLPGPIDVWNDFLLQLMSS